MKTKVLFLLLAGCIVAFTAWFVHRNNTCDFNSENRLTAITQGAVPNPAQADEIPEKYRETVQKGLAYLVKNQFENGHWAGDGGKHPVAMTGLVGLALLMKRNPPASWPPIPPRDANYSANIRKAVDWLMAKSQTGRDGLIFSEHPSETARYMQGHGLATLFLAGASVRERDSDRRAKLTDILTRAVKYLVKAQSTQGGWYDTSRVEGHDLDTISATVIQIQGLQAAENVGIPVPHEAINDAQEYLKQALGKVEEAANPGQTRSRPGDTAGALASRFKPEIYQYGNPPGETKDEICKKWIEYCQTEIPVGRDIQFGRDESSHYYYAQAVFKVGGDTWTRYRTAMFDHLQSTQNKDGSWPASDGLSVGSVYSTALWCIVLQLDRNRHPSTRELMETR